MCGRLNVATDPLTRMFMRLLGEAYPGEASPNVAPTEQVWVVHRDDAALRSSAMRWSLLPYWSREAKPRQVMINARAETVASNGAFKEPFARRRCLVPVAGYFEWQTEEGRRMPQHVTAADGEALLLAGIWDRWRRDDQLIQSFAVVTTAVHAHLEFLHDRQPVMLGVDDAPRWLDHTHGANDLADLLAPRLPVDVLVTPLSNALNNARNKDPACLQPIGNPRFVSASAARVA